MCDGPAVVGINAQRCKSMAIAAALCALMVPGCGKKTAKKPPTANPSAVAAPPAPPPSREAATGGPRTTRSSPSGKTDVVSGLAAGDAAMTIADEVALAAGEGRRCLVYVGAPWCEPCKRFKKALLAGELDAQLDGLRMLEFDADRDRDRLATAGYSFRLVPFFAAPGPDGRSSGRATGGVPSKDAPMQPLADRVKALLSSPRSAPPASSG